jgi:hypothetical protein
VSLLADAPPLAPPQAAPTPTAPARRRRRLAAGAFVLALGAGVVGAFALASTHASSPAGSLPAAPGAVTCKVGFYVESLHDGNVTAGTFSADLWAWSVCPEGRAGSAKPLDTIEFTNADNVQKSFESTTTEQGGIVYSSARVTGQFRHTYQLGSYPFDRQRFVIQFEDTNSDSAQLAYSPDVANTGCAPHLTLEDWTVSSCSLSIDRHAYATNFGDPAEASGTLHIYDRGTLALSATRAQPVTEYLKSTSIIYPSVLLIMISFFLMTEATNTLGARMSTAGGALFSVALSMKALSSQLNADNHLTLMDGIGLLALACVVIAGGTAMWCQRRLDEEVSFAEVRAASHRLGWTVLGVFLALNGLLVALAVR